MIVEEFTPKAMAATDDEVMSLVFFRIQGKKGGKGSELFGEMLLHHYWRFHAGKVAFWRGSEDTLQMLDVIGPPHGPA